MWLVALHWVCRMCELATHTSISGSSISFLMENYDFSCFVLVKYADVHCNIIIIGYVIIMVTIVIIVGVMSIVVHARAPGYTLTVK